MQYVEPAISQFKYKEELKKFYKIRDDWQKRGVFLLNEVFPVVEFLYTIPKLIPSTIAFAVRIDFSNYDVEPPSVKFISPFTKEVVSRNQIQLLFPQIRLSPPVDSKIKSPIQSQDLLQGPPDGIPFFCIPGIKEYHDHPAHSGDSWFLYRKNGEGSLGFILDQLYNNSIPYIKGLNIQLQIVGFKQEVNFQIANGF